MSTQTQIWQEQTGKAVFRVQTDDMGLHRKMLKREEFKLIAEGLNTGLWVYLAEFSTIHKARRVFNDLMGPGIEIRF